MRLLGGRIISALTNTHMLSYKSKNCINAVFGQLMQFLYLTIFSNRLRWHTADHNFPFSIFNFQFTLRSGNLILTLVNLSSRTGNGGLPYYLSFKSTYSLFSEMLIYAGRIILPQLISSSSLCALQPVIRAVAKSGV